MSFDLLMWVRGVLVAFNWLKIFGLCGVGQISCHAVLMLGSGLIVCVACQSFSSLQLGGGRLSLVLIGSIL